MLALRLIRGAVALATDADARVIPLPLPLAGVGMPMPMFNIPISDKNRWYVGRGGVYSEVGRAGFAEGMSIYPAHDLEVAGKVARRESNYQHSSMPAIITAYNAGRVDK